MPRDQVQYYGIVEPRHGGGELLELAVDVARACGASANFAGSGGAIVGTYQDAAALDRLRPALDAIGCDVIEPQVA